MASALVQPPFFGREPHHHPPVSRESYHTTGTLGSCTGRRKYDGGDYRSAWWSRITGTRNAHDHRPFGPAAHRMPFAVPSPFVWDPSFDVGSTLFNDQARPARTDPRMTRRVIAPCDGHTTPLLPSASPSAAQEAVRDDCGPRRAPGRQGQADGARGFGCRWANLSRAPEQSPHSHNSLPLVVQALLDYAVRSEPRAL